MRNFSSIFFCLIFLFSSVYFNEIKAQSFADKSFHTFGYTPIAEFGDTPVVYYNAQTEFGDDPKFEKFGAQGSFLTVISFNYGFRYNLAEVNDNFAIGALVNPGFGLSVYAYKTGQSNESKVGLFTLPVMASLNFGNGATYNSAANIGGFLAAGIEYNLNPLFPGEDAFDVTETLVAPNRSWVQPVFAVGIRYWSRNSRAREIALKYGFRNGDSYVKEETGETETAKIYTFRLSFNWMLNY